MRDMFDSFLVQILAALFDGFFGWLISAAFALHSVDLVGTRGQTAIDAA